ncbi:MAG: Cna B-type domain-containing protein [Firmicutes bacterium]|nr:Cna B-type domain-containing protein [Bacillota bacterium]
MKISKKTGIPFLIVLFIIAFAAAVNAAEKFELKLDYVQPDVRFGIYRVGSIENGKIVPAEEFAQYDVNYTEKSAASTLAGYVLRDKPNPKAEKRTNSENVCVFGGLENGVYLVMGDSVTADGSKYTPSPALIAVDGKDVVIEVKYEKSDEGGSEHGGGDADKTTTETSTETTTQSRSRGGSTGEASKDGSSSKGGSSVKAMPLRASVTKVWRGGDRAESVVVQLLKDGEVYEEKTLNADNNWRFSWDKLDKNSDWTVVEKEVAAGYKVNVEKKGSSWVITNTSETLIEEEEKKDTFENEENTETDDKNYTEFDNNTDGSFSDGGNNGIGNTDKDEETESVTDESYGYDSQDRNNDHGGNISVSENGKTDGGKLPQTGQPWLPVIGLSLAGLVFLTIGEYRKKGRKE